MSKKILMLHGLAQSGEYFSSKTLGFCTEMNNLGYSLYYATAPNKYPPADLPDFLNDIERSAINSTEVLAWLKDDPVNNSYQIPETTINYLHDYILKHGPFDGIVGFSQGAGVAGYLVTDFNNLLRLTNDQQPELKFFMSFSGFRFKPEEYQEQYDRHPICIPSLHVQGELDTVSEPAKVKALYDACQDGTRTHLMHKGGHFVPNSRGFLKKVVAWMQENQLA